MFVYGCTRVIRYCSLLNHTAILYCTKDVLKKLNMSLQEFREICILSGNDYNVNANGNTSSMNLLTTIKHFNKYKAMSTNKKEKETFCDWLNDNTDYVSDNELFQKLVNIFDVKNCIDLAKFDKIRIANGPIMKKELKELLASDGFIFVE